MRKALQSEYTSLLADHIEETGAGASYRSFAALARAQMSHGHGEDVGARSPEAAWEMTGDMTGGVGDLETESSVKVVVRGARSLALLASSETSEHPLREFERSRFHSGGLPGFPGAAHPFTGSQTIGSHSTPVGNGLVETVHCGTYSFFSLLRRRVFFCLGAGSRAAIEYTHHGSAGRYVVSRLLSVTLASALSEAVSGLGAGDWFW